MERVDILLVQSGLFPSRQKAIEAIKQGQVSVNGKKVLKPSEKVSIDSKFEAKTDLLKYVSRGGFKLEGAIKQFGLDLSGATLLDMGSSTGGFTDCALQHGAKRVYAVDVGSGQLVDKLKNDERVISMENTDIRDLSKEIIEDCDYIVGDISFISIVKILTSINDHISNQKLFLLIKPQFECGVELAKKYKGTIRDYNLSKKICNETLEKLKTLGFKVYAVADSPIKGGDGNSEFVALLKKEDIK